MKNTILKPFVPFLLIPIFLVLIAGIMVFLLAETYPFHPEHTLYPLQLRAEQLQLALIPNQVSKANRALDLADRRLSDLAMAQGETQITNAIVHFSQALDQAIIICVAVPEDLQPELFRRFERLLRQSEVVARSLNEIEGGALLTWLKGKITTLEGTETMVQAAAAGSDQVQAQPVSFLGEVDHRVYPLRGMHTQIACSSCHPAGGYVDTPTACKDCHQPPAEKLFAMSIREVAINVPDFSMQVDHFQGDCSDCHIESSWNPYQFDHKGVTTCQSCHDDDLPDMEKDFNKRMLGGSIEVKPTLYSHYPGDCNVCHTSTTSWKVYSFEHEPDMDCESCHGVEEPIAHYDEACVDCHVGTSRWDELDIAHEKFTDCISCHEEQEPEVHYLGACSNCHSTESWGDINFSHGSLKNCESCHAVPDEHHSGWCGDCHTTGSWADMTWMHINMPCTDCHTVESGHYPGACESCHSLSNWEDITINHKSLPDCESCHTAPLAHYPGQCSLCHNTTVWYRIDFLHDVTLSCQSCHIPPTGHYGELCTVCHLTTTWVPIPFEHGINTNCLECHIAPVQHYPGQCFYCHLMDSWTEIIFDHAFFPDCDSCHKPPLGHWPGECSNCHWTTNWVEISFDHTNYTDCKACHPRPASHSPGQCSKCHTTTSWEIQVTPTPLPQLTVTPPTPTYTPMPTETPVPPTATPVP